MLLKAYASSNFLYAKRFAPPLPPRAVRFPFNILRVLPLMQLMIRNTSLLEPCNPTNELDPLPVIYPPSYCAMTPNACVMLYGRYQIGTAAAIFYISQSRHAPPILSPMKLYGVGGSSCACEKLMNNVH